MQLISKDRLKDILASFKTIEPILVIGDLGIDKYTHGEVLRISPEAPVPVLEVTKEWMQLGLAANISNNLVELGVKNNLCGIVGDDSHKIDFLNLLKERRLSGDCLLSLSNRPTTFKERITTKTQQICRVDYESVERITIENEDKLFAIIENVLPESSAIILEDYGKGLLVESFIQKVISLAKKNKKLVTVDPSRSTPPLFYKGADLLKPNFTEAKIMATSLGYHEKDLAGIAKTLMDKLDLQMLAITLGPEGIAICEKTTKKLEVVPTIATQVFDVSGAGDTAISVITSALAANSSLIEAAWMANCASGVVVGKTGTATVSQKELERFHRRMVQEFSES